MNDNNQFLDYLEDILRFDHEIIQALQREGITSFRQLRDMTNSAIHEMCVTIRRQRLTQGNGVTISTWYELLLRKLAYYLRHLIRTQRVFDENIATEAELHRIAELEIEELMAAAIKGTTPPKLESVTKIRVTIENIKAYCSVARGTNGAALSYVIRPIGALVEGQVFANDQEEMVHRAPHRGRYWGVDNARVWNLLRAMLCDTDGWAWVSSFENAKDGRSAFIALQNHYLGPANQSLIKTQAEQVLATLYFDGARRGFTLEKYAQAHKQAHKDLDDYNEGLSEGRKVRYFLTGIRYPLLEAPRGTVYATPFLRENFDETVSFILQFYASLPPSAARRNVGAVMNHGPGRGGRGGGGRGGGGNVGNRGRGGGRFFGGGRGRGQGAGGGGRGYANRFGIGGRGRLGAGRGGAGGQQHQNNADGGFIPMSKWVTLDKAQQQRIRDIRSEAAKATGAVIKRELDYDDGSTVATTVSTAPAGAAAGHAGEQMSQRPRRTVD